MWLSLFLDAILPIVDCCYSTKTLWAVKLHVQPGIVVYPSFEPLHETRTLLPVRTRVFFLFNNLGERELSTASRLFPSRRTSIWPPHPT